MAGLLERESELSALSASLHAGLRGGGAVIAIEGPPGIGKSALLAAARELAVRHDARVLAARGGELEREFSYGVVRHLFEPILGSASTEERARLTTGAAGHSAALFEAPTAAVEKASVAETSFAMLHGLFWLAANIARERPLLLSIDDLHWCDGPSLRFLDYLGQRLEGLPIVVAGTLRPDEPGADGLLLGSITSGALTTCLEPRPLSEEAAGELVRSALSSRPDPSFTRSCYAASGGNPLLLHELARALLAEGVPPTADQADVVAGLGPRAVSRTVGLRLARLGPGVARFAQAAAVLGDGGPLRQAAALAGLDDEAAYEAVAALSRLDVIRPGRTIEFVHPVVRAAVYSGVPAGERERAHARAARLLAEGGAPPERVAAHLLLTTPAGDASAAATLREAARRSLHSGDPEAASAYLTRAVEEPPRAEERSDVLFELGAARMLVEAESAVAHLEGALALASGPHRRAEVAEVLCSALLLAGRLGEAVEVGSRAIEDLGEARPELRRRLQAAVLSTAQHEPSLNHVTTELIGHVREVDGEDFGAKALIALVAFADARRLDAPAIEAAARAERALAGGVLLREDHGGSSFLAATFTLALADSDQSLRAYDAALAEAETKGSILGFAGNKIYSAHARLLRGDLDEAVADAQAGLDACEAHAIPVGAPWAGAYLAAAETERGDLDAAERALARAEPEGGVPEGLHGLSYRDSRAAVLIARGEVRTALNETLRLGRLFAAVGGRNPAFLAWRSRAALCMTELGEDRAQARRLADEELELARLWGAPRALGVALRAKGLVTGGNEGVGLLREAVEALDGSPARLELARALTDLGAALRRANRRSEAREPLRRGMDLAHHCAAAPLEERARHELRASGARPRRAVVTGASSLTPSEQRVARMAAEGHTNRDIAQKLFVTPKTVEVHLSHAYAKLDISSRSQLSRALGSVG